MHAVKSMCIYYTHYHSMHASPHLGTRMHSMPAAPNQTRIGRKHSLGVACTTQTFPGSGYEGQRTINSADADSQSPHGALYDVQCVRTLTVRKLSCSSTGFKVEAARPGPRGLHCERLPIDLSTSPRGRAYYSASVRLFGGGGLALCDSPLPEAVLRASCNGLQEPLAARACGASALRLRPPVVCEAVGCGCAQCVGLQG